MDFHFYTPKNVTPKKGSLTKTLRTFLPIFVLAGILPVVLGLMKNPITDRFTSEAASDDLTIWFTPANVVTSVDKPVELVVHAKFESDDLLPGVNFKLTSTNGSISPSTIDYIKPFNGETTVGKIVVNPQTVGNLKLQVDESTVVSKTFSRVFHLYTSSALIVVQ